MLLFGCGEESASSIEAKIAGSQKLRHLDHICGELPKPPTFILKRKVLSGNANLSIIEYRYGSQQFAEIIEFFKALPSDSGYSHKGVYDNGLIRMIRLKKLLTFEVQKNKRKAAVRMAAFLKCTQPINYGWVAMVTVGENWLMGARAEDRVENVHCSRPDGSRTGYGCCSRTGIHAGIPAEVSTDTSFIF